MTDRFNLTFTNSEHDLYVQLVAEKNPSGLLKGLLKAYLNGDMEAQAEDAEPELNQALIEGLLMTFIGDDIENYQGESQFLANVDLRSRIRMLNVNHPKEADAVIALAKAKYPFVGAKL